MCDPGVALTASVAAYGTFLVGHVAWIGGVRNSTDPGPWFWIDGTPANSLNCGSPGCGLWIHDQPRYGRCCGGLCI